MQKILGILFLVFLFFVTQLFLFNTVGKYFTPHLILLLIIFITLLLGIRYGLLTAVLSGLIFDSYSTDIFGLNVFSFIACSYLVVVLRKYFYRTGSRLSVFLLSAYVILFDIFLKMMTQAWQGAFDFKQTFYQIILPELFMTLLVSFYVYRGLRQCASRLFA